MQLVVKVLMLISTHADFIQPTFIFTSELQSHLTNILINLFPGFGLRCSNSCNTETKQFNIVLYCIVAQSSPIGTLLQTYSFPSCQFRKIVLYKERRLKALLNVTSWYIVQIAAFRSIYDSHGEQLLRNFRPIQPLNNRIVYTSIPSSESPKLHQPLASATVLATLSVVMAIVTHNWLS